MNSRILKKLCLRAEKHPELFKHFIRVSDGSNDPVSICKFDRKHKEEWCKPKAVPYNYITLAKNTPCYGSSSGGYEPEWEDRPAYLLLKEWYITIHTIWYVNPNPEYIGVPIRKLTPSVVFKYFDL